MVKRRKLVAELNDEGFQGVGGAKHEKFIHPDGRWTEVPRHSDIKDTTAKAIRKQAGLK